MGGGRAADADDTERHGTTMPTMPPMPPMPPMPTLPSLSRVPTSPWPRWTGGTKVSLVKAASAMAASAMAASLSARAFAINCDPDARDAPDDARRRGQAPFTPQTTRADADRAQMDAADAWGAFQMFLVPADGDGARGMGPNEWPPHPTAMAATPAWPRQTPLAATPAWPRQTPLAATPAWSRQTPPATEARVGDSTAAAMEALAAAAYARSRQTIFTPARAGAISAAAMEALADAAYARSRRTIFTPEARAGAISAAAMEALAARVAARVAARGVRRAKHMDGAGHGAGPSALIATLAVARAPCAPGRPNICARLANRDTADRPTFEWAAAMAAQRNRLAPPALPGVKAIGVAAAAAVALRVSE